MKTPRHISQVLCSAVALLSLCAHGLGQNPVPKYPVSTFELTPPTDPPSGPPAVAPVAFLGGNYVDTDYLGGSVDMATDESGKVVAMGNVNGYTDKKDGSNAVRRTGSVKTINGIPHLMATASANGTYVDTAGLVTPQPHPISGSGTVKIPLGPTQPGAGNTQPVTVMSSYSGRFAGNPDKAKPEESTLDLDKGQVANIVEKSWSMKVSITEKIDAKGKPFVVATVDLKKPDGTRTIFPEKKVIFSELNGYTFARTGGTDVDPATGVPKLDTKGKPVIDKKSRVRFTKLMFKKYFDVNDAPYWQPAAGAVAYQFLGQKGLGQLFNFDIQNL